MIETREKLRRLSEALLDMAIDLRETRPDLSYSYYAGSETCKKAVDEMERLEPVKRRPEGGGGTWFNVCEECQGQVDTKDKFCRWCGHPLI